MKNSNFNMEQILNAKSVEELDAIPEVELIVYGPERKRKMIHDYNNMIKNYGDYSYDIRTRKEEIITLRGKGKLARLFKGEKIDERIAVLEREIKEIEANKKGYDALIDEALKCIQQLEEEIQRAAKQVFKSTGLSVYGFADAYHIKRKELMDKLQNAKRGEAQAEPASKGE